MDKPFKTIEEQVELLEARGVATDDDTPEVLLREGYYSVVNGYKAPFIDKEKSESAKDDRYLPGTSFADIYALFMFDRELRMLSNTSPLRRRPSRRHRRTASQKPISERKSRTSTRTTTTQAPTKSASFSRISTQLSAENLTGSQNASFTLNIIRRITTRCRYGC